MDLRGFQPRTSTEPDLQQLGRVLVDRALVGRSGTRCGIARSRTIGSEPGGPSPSWTERSPETLHISTEPDLQRLGRSRADRHQVGPSTLSSAAAAAAAAATAAATAVAAAAASRSRAERVHFGRSVAPCCKPGRSRTYTVGQDPRGLIRVGRSGESAPGAGPT